MFVLRGAVPYGRDVDPAYAQKRIAAALERVRARDIRQTPGAISFRGGLFRWVTRHNVLNAFRAGALTIAADRREVQYELDTSQLAAGAAIMIVLMSLFAPPLWTYVAVLAGMLIAVPIDLARFRRFLRNAIDNVPS